MYKPLLTFSKEWFESAPSTWAGSYTDEDKMDWYTCRERFHMYGFKEYTKQIYMIAPTKTKNGYRKTVPVDGHSIIARFMANFESEMGLAQKHRLKFYRYKNNKVVLGVKVSEWWRANEARRQLLTILLRAPVTTLRHPYKLAKDFTRTIRRDPYLRQTSKAVKVFMNGKTKLRAGHFDYAGWVDTFSYGDVDALC